MNALEPRNVRAVMKRVVEDVSAAGSDESCGPALRRRHPQLADQWLEPPHIPIHWLGSSPLECTVALKCVSQYAYQHPEARL
ncbi:hypothetical protein HPB48_022645 [Haemaphysalis longicornis]|uniref:Uncharacterized protein n=1 Tax=Haemaphysalis longicornis TaxID=44386 RepID=A0A9J6GHG7_HAELO|nr:hypothetical protein HPB48_022645 [Haemaphysalis longicornis]